MRFEDGGSYPVDNLFAKLGQGGRHLAFAGHVDVVPPGARDAWADDPFAGVIRRRAAVRPRCRRHEERRRLRSSRRRHASSREDGPPAGSLSLLITGDEEREAVNGTVKLLAWAAERGERFDACIVGEPTCPERLGDTAKIGRRGSVSCELTVRGRQGHTAYPQRADNAAHRLVAVLAPADRDAARPGHRVVRALEPAGDLDRHRQSGRQRHPRRGHGALQHPLQRPPHPARAWRRGCTAQIAPLAPDYALAVDGNAEAFVTAPGELSELLARSVEAETGLRPELSTSGGTSDARFFPRYCPVVEFGLVGTTMHQADEHVAVADIEGLTRIYQRFLQLFFAAADAQLCRDRPLVQAAWLLARGDAARHGAARPVGRRASGAPSPRPCSWRRPTLLCCSTSIACSAGPTSRGAPSLAEALVLRSWAGSPSRSPPSSLTRLLGPERAATCR